MAHNYGMKVEPFFEVLSYVFSFKALISPNLATCVHECNIYILTHKQVKVVIEKTVEKDLGVACQLRIYLKVGLTLSNTTHLIFIFQDSGDFGRTK